jgi:hypothetical protein
MAVGTNYMEGRGFVIFFLLVFRRNVFSEGFCSLGAGWPGEGGGWGVE